MSFPKLWSVGLLVGLASLAVTCRRPQYDPSQPVPPASASSYGKTIRSESVIYAADYGLTCDGLTVVDSAWSALMTKISANARIRIPRGVCITHTGLTIGNGTNLAQSTKGYNFTLEGEGIGGGNTSNIGVQPATVLKYDGPTDTSAAVLTIAGPIHNVYLRDVALDANGKAGVGLKVIHLNDWQFERIQVLNWMTNSYVFTTRPSFVPGAPWGMSNGSCYDCYAYGPVTGAASGMLWTSGVAGGVSLVGNPDTASNRFYGGVMFYGGANGSYGVKLDGADNNLMEGTQIIPKAGSKGGNSILLAQWPAASVFPHENVFRKLGIHQNVGGVGGTGCNKFEAFATSDGADFPVSNGCVSGDTIVGQSYVNGARVYRIYDMRQATLNNSLKSTRSSSYVDVPDMAVTSAIYPPGAKAVVSFTGMATKANTGIGNFILDINGQRYGPTQQQVSANGAYQSVAATYEVDLPRAGTTTAKVQFEGDGKNAICLRSGVLSLQILY